MNEKGQAIVEAALIMTLTLVGLFFVIKKGLQVPLDFYVDELVEKALICEFQNQPNCSSRLYQHLQKFRFRNIVIRTDSTKNRKVLHLAAISPFGFKIEKESILELKLKNI